MSGQHIWLCVGESPRDHPWKQIGMRVSKHPFSGAWAESDSASNTTMLHACSEGHDWQAVEWAKTGWSVLVVCRRCVASQWVGGMGGTPGKPTDARSGRSEVK